MLDGRLIDAAATALLPGGTLTIVVRPARIELYSLSSTPTSTRRLLLASLLPSLLAPPIAPPLLRRTMHGTPICYSTASPHTRPSRGLCSQPPACLPVPRSCARLLGSSSSRQHLAPGAAMRPVRPLTSIGFGRRDSRSTQRRMTASYCMSLLASRRALSPSDEHSHSESTRSYTQHSSVARRRSPREGLFLLTVPAVCVRARARRV